MTDHDHYEELAALSAGGLLSEQEIKELRGHTEICPECLKTEEAFVELVRSGIPLTVRPFREFLERMRTPTDDAIRDRFLARARREGLVFSPRLEKPQKAKRLGPVLGATLAVAVALLLAFYGTKIYSRVLPGFTQSDRRIGELQQQNSALNATLSQLTESLAAEQREVQNLRAQLGTANRAAESLRHENDDARNEAARSVSQNVQLPVELADRNKQLEDAQKEIARINQLHASDEASLVAQQVRIAELSDQLRVASATLDLERQLTAAGKDIRELLTARQLHVIDVRDTDANGKPSKAFGRIFVTEGKSLTFYAFDLSEERTIDAKHRFEVWGAQQAKGSAAHNLGMLYVDDKAQRRWALKVNDTQLVKEVDSVFVTVEPAGGATTPSGQGLLYAYLGQPNHP
jgi:hypothetical protein